MKIRISLILFLFSSLCSSAASESYGSVSSTADHCRVLELIRFHNPQEFTCRVDQWKGVENIKLRVRIRNFSMPVEEKITPQIQQSVQDYLSRSGKVILENIQDRNYFRVIADVRVDRIDLIAALQGQGLIPQEKSQPEKPQDIETIPEISVRGYSLEPLFPRNTKTGFPKPDLKPLYSKESLEKVLNTEADLSGLSSNISLKEALEIIRLSVEPPLPMVILWNDLQQNLYLDPEMPIGVDGFNRIPLKLAMELILSSVSPGGERPVVLQEGSLLLIVSSRFAARRMRPDVYDISELANIPVFVDEYGQTGGGISYTNSGGSGRR